MRRLAAVNGFMSFWLVMLGAQPKLLREPWGILALLMGPAILWSIYFFVAAPGVRRAEAAQPLNPEPVEQEIPRTHILSWLGALPAYWLMAFGGLFTGFEFFARPDFPLWFRPIFLVCAVGCGVLGFFLGWEDLQTYLKERRALKDWRQQPDIAAIEGATQAGLTIVENPESEVVPLRRG